MQQSGKRDVALQSAVLSEAVQNNGRRAAPNRKQIAAAGEQVAAQYLIRLGLRLVSSNWRSGRFGEIDLIFEDTDGMLIFVEVKTRRRRVQDHHLDDDGFSSIDWRKQRQLLICARSYLARTKSMYTSCRMDAILVRHKQSHFLENNQVQLKDVTVLHVANAFGCP